MRCVFFLMIRRPPSSTPFPTRRSSDLLKQWDKAVPAYEKAIASKDESVVRSEEHTSELQSHSDLVCRLLLEKKNYFHFSLHIYSLRLEQILPVVKTNYLLQSFLSCLY